MGFFDTIRRDYGEDVHQDIKTWANTNKKLANYQNHLRFLLQCRKRQVLPVHLSCSINCLQYLLIEDNPLKNQCANLFRSFQFKCLNLEISHVHWKINILNSLLNTSKSKLLHVLPYEVYNSFSLSQQCIYDSLFKSTKTKQKHKIDKLLLEQKGNCVQYHIEDKWFMNLTQTEFPNDVKYLLSLGDKFNLPYDKNQLPLEQLIIDCEYIIDFLPNEDIKNEKRNLIVNCITNFQKDHSNKDNLALHKIERETKKFLKDNTDILILKADKGNTTVAIDKKEYHKKTTDILSDTNTYIILKKDPTITIQNKLNKTIDQLVASNLMTAEQSKIVKCNCGVFPKMYFQPKIHKNTVPLRPIVSFVGSPTYALTKFLSNLISHAFVRDQYHVKDSFEMVKYIQGFSIPDDHILISLDVISLFTNIPTDLTIELLKDRWSLIEDHCELTLDAFVSLLQFCFDNSYFSFDDKFYRQIFGLGMGNCLSPVCSDVVMSELQTKCIDKLDFKLPFFKRYVDDIITCVPIDKISTLLDAFNSFHPRLQFTVEREDNNSIAFLDLLLIRTHDNKIKTDWYHKPTFSERFLNFRSQHSFKQKINIIKNLKNRALQLSHPDFHQKNLSNIKTYLIKNDYPSKLIDKLLKQPTNQISKINNTQAKYFKIPYIQNLSERIARHLTSENVNIAFSNENKNRKLFSKQKTRTPHELVSNVIYKIPCNDCNGVYIGQTGRYLKTRIAEHKRSVRPNILINTKNKTALAEHFDQKQHIFNYDNITIVGQQQNYKKRLVNEMIEIKKHPTNINKKQDVEKLSVAYHNILKSKQHPVLQHS